jgi:hypothetical protein
VHGSFATHRDYEPNYPSVRVADYTATCFLKSGQQIGCGKRTSPTRRSTSKFQKRYCRLRESVLPSFMSSRCYRKELTSMMSSFASPYCELSNQRPSGESDGPLPKSPFTSKPGVFAWWQDQNSSRYTRIGACRIRYCRTQRIA